MHYHTAFTIYKTTSDRQPAHSNNYSRLPQSGIQPALQPIFTRRPAHSSNCSQLSQATCIQPAYDNNCSQLSQSGIKPSLFTRRPEHSNNYSLSQDTYNLRIIITSINCHNPGYSLKYSQDDQRVIITTVSCHSPDFSLHYRFTRRSACSNTCFANSANWNSGTLAS
ncbi:hypothetical protein BaRGS_00027431 [Batillaria attramentaria]|uniref:Uncharacterized protein n=1 Tax=Batillaria attramentaria TaxID=370345 RepID=A0ABD0K3B3_9CAEN